MSRAAYIWIGTVTALFMAMGAWIIIDSGGPEYETYGTVVSVQFVEGT